MTLSTDAAINQQLSLPEELILMLLNEESGYFRQIPGWDLNCAVAGAALAELSFNSRIDTDMESLFLIDDAEIGHAALDPILKEIAAEPVQRDAQYWIERLAPRADSIIDLTLGHLVDLEILDYHEGDYWTLSNTADMFIGSEEDTAIQFVKTRIARAIFNNEIPEPRDIVIIALINTCDVFRFIFQMDDESQERVEQISKMDLIARAIGAAVAENLVGPLLRRPSLSKPIPTVPIRKLLLNPHVRSGNMPALFSDLAKEFGPVYQLKPPFSKDPLIFLAGAETNHWVHRHGRNYLRARDYLQDFEKVYGASGIWNTTRARRR